MMDDIYSDTSFGLSILAVRSMLSGLGMPWNQLETIEREMSILWSPWRLPPRGGVDVIERRVKKTSSISGSTSRSPLERVPDLNGLEDASGDQDNDDRREYE